MDYTEKVLVLKVGRFREADAWVRLLSPSKGVMTAFAFGGLKSRRRFCGCLDALNLVLFRFKTGRSGYPTLEEGALVHGFPGFRADSGRQGMAVNCVKFIEAVQVGPDGGRSVFDLLLETLYILEGLQEPPQALPLLFRAKMVFEQGYGPEFLRCSVCGKDADRLERPKFSVEKGQVVCSPCRSDDSANGSGPTIPVTLGSLRTMDWIRTHGPADWPKLNMNVRTKGECYNIIERLSAFHLGLEWADGFFRKV